MSNKMPTRHKQSEVEARKAQTVRIDDIWQRYFASVPGSPLAIMLLSQIRAMGSGVDLDLGGDDDE